MFIESNMENKLNGIVHRKIWIIIPARGGSVGIPRKNIKLLAGKPLISYSLESSIAAVGKMNVVVVTDDSEIYEVALDLGVKIILEEFPTPPEETLDTKIVRNIPALLELGARPDDLVVTVQPTSPLLRPETILDAVNLFDSGANSVISVSEDRHLRWKIGHNNRPIALFKKRVNRQSLPVEYKETGAIVVAKLNDIQILNTRIVEPVKLLPLKNEESIDIDSFVDFLAAEHLLTRMRIVIRADASREIGMGHIYRALALAYELSRHDITIVTNKSMPLGQEVLSQKPFKHHAIENETEFIGLLEKVTPNLVIMDVLDTQKEQTSRIKDVSHNLKLVSFEDMGPGAVNADLLVNEFCQASHLNGVLQLTGLKYSVLAPTFEMINRNYRLNSKVETILILFGGTDPSNLAEKVLVSLREIKYSGKVRLVRGLGAKDISISKYPFEIEVYRNVKNMAQLMSGSDLAFTSGGRTISELAEIGVPSICMAQNKREQEHPLAIYSKGVRYLGLGSEVSDAKLQEAIIQLIENVGLRQKLHFGALAEVEGRSNQKIITQILEHLGLNHLN